MCDSIFIAATNPLPLIAWDENSPAFHVMEITNEENWVRKYLTAQNVYYAGSYQGCGCGYNYFDAPDVDEEEKLAAQESVRQFRFYLERISQNNTIQIFIDSMNGSFDNIQIKDITPAYFAGDNFELEETQLLTVYSE